ncbi:hypothetical protein RFZ03_00185, partial [Acinetobacter baumannii]|nr:hypothetical protein [Acinetobacter baumannii]
LGDQIKHGADFVCDQKFCIFPQSSGNAEPLQLSAGKLLRIPLFPVFFYTKLSYDPLIYVFSVCQGISKAQLWIDCPFRMLPYHLHRTVSF